MMHPFPNDPRADIPEHFNDPFRYAPDALVRTAALQTLELLESWKKMPEGTRERELEKSLSEGKMLGVLTVMDEKGNIGYLRGFSGNIAGCSTVEGFVPPVYDLLDPEGGFRKGEARLNGMNREIMMLDSSEELAAAKAGLQKAEEEKEAELAGLKSLMAKAKAERKLARATTEDEAVLAGLVRESQYQKANLHRTKAAWDEKIRAMREVVTRFEDKRRKLCQERARLSDMLQKWIFEQYIVSDAKGNKASIQAIFAENGLTPPGGTGECAAPKLLNHAYRNSLKPLSMGEFWYGASPHTAVRTHGHFYPSCTSKCGPLLGYMLNGLTIRKEAGPEQEPAILFEDTHLIAAVKPSGMPSVPGLDGRLSCQEWLEKHLERQIHPVHRLDMDTSGIILYACTKEAAAHMQRQFENHTVSKTYAARLSPCDIPGQPLLHKGQKGSISLPLSPDYDERPRQKVDPSQGKPCITEYEVKDIRTDGSTYILFRPKTGRTHQLRVHSAHKDGLGRPIMGDMLYGGSEADRLCLHAQSIVIVHPDSGKELTFSSDRFRFR